MQELGPFGCITADPPWHFGDALPGVSRGASRNYATMTTDEICAMKLPPIFDNAYLFLWRVSAMVEDAYKVVRAWGFEPKSEMVWNKLTANGKKHFGLGRHVRAAHETCIVAVRGRPIRVKENVSSTFEGIVGEHSEKPEIFYDKVELIVGGAPKVELFSRRQRVGWTCLGMEMPTPTVF